MDKKVMTELGGFFSTVYEDRLLAESYIYQLSDHLYRKKMLIDNSRDAAQLAAAREAVGSHNAAITALVKNYEKTQLTPAESVLFRNFRSNLERMLEAEAAVLPGREPAAAREQLDAQFQLASANLSRLSGIQVSEGRLLNEKSHQNIAGSALLTQLELAVLIGIGLIIQGLIFTSGSFGPKITPPNPGLN
jgi:hypothetical protein